MFLAHVLDADVPEDTLSPQANDETVLVTTPAGTVGLEFDTAVVAALQDGVWPNLRLRGSLLAPQELVRLVTGVDSTTVDERRQVLGDELRMFVLAISRARRRLVVAAVANEDEAASVFLGLLPDAPTLDSSPASTPLSLRALVGRLRSRSTPTSAAGFPERRIDSSETGITPSDLYPTSTRTSSLSTRTTVPVTTCPSVMSGNVAS